MATVHATDTPLAALVFTRSGKCLSYCEIGKYAQRPLLKPSALCQLLTTMQAVAGYPSEGYVQLHGVGIVLLEGYNIVVAVLCNSQTGVDAARLVGMQALNVCGKLYRKPAAVLDEEHKRETSAAVTSYTVHSATNRAVGGSTSSELPGGAAASTPLAFAAFRQAFLQPLLLRAPAAELWLSPLQQSTTSALRSFLVNPTPLISQQSILLNSAPRADRPLARWAGPHASAAWTEVLKHAQLVLQARATERSPANDKQNRRARLALLAFPELSHGGSCLHAAIRAARIIPGGACLVAFYEAPTPASMSPRGQQQPAMSESDGSEGCALVLAEASAPHELRVALNHTARLISTAFPTAVTSLPDLGATPPAALEEDEEAAPPATPVQQQRTRMDAPATPLNLSIESPRLADAPPTHSPTDRDVSNKGSADDNSPPTPPPIGRTRRELYAASTG